MKFRKTLFFEIPNKDFIMPVYKEDDVNTLKSFLQEDTVLFSVGYKSTENNEGLYFIGQVKNVTEKFCLKYFPLVIRKRILDILNGLEESPQMIDFVTEEIVIKKIVAFQMTKSGPQPRIYEYNEMILNKLNKLAINDYYIKEIPILTIRNTGSSEMISKEEIFYQIKNPNF